MASVNFCLFLSVDDGHKTLIFSLSVSVWFNSCIHVHDLTRNDEHVNESSFEFFSLFYSACEYMFYSHSLLTLISSSLPLPFYSFSCLCTNITLCKWIHFAWWCCALRLTVAWMSNEHTVPLLEDHLIPEPKWSHYDFTFGTNVGPVVNDKIISILKKAEKVPDDELVIDYWRSIGIMCDILICPF